MPFGVSQLLYIGAQNIFITTQPEISYFKIIYKRHTNFSIDTVQEFFDGNIGYGQKIRCKLSKNGDLLHSLRMYFRLGSLNKISRKNNLNPNALCNTTKVKNCLCTCSQCLYDKHDDVLTYGYCNSIGHALLEYVEIWIGGQMIDRHYGEWLEIWSELTQTAEKKLGYNEMIGKKDPMSYTYDSFTENMELYIPFTFWFCRNVGLSLPVMAMIYHDVEIIIKLRNFDGCWVSNKKNSPRPCGTIDGCLLADYIYLSAEERKKFYQESHIYLMEQVQQNELNNLDNNTGNMNIDLYFNHPVKELVWFVQRNDVKGYPDGTYLEDPSYPKGNDHFNYTTSKIPRLLKISDSFSYAKLILSGVDRTQYWPASYYRLLQNYDYHTRIPTSNCIYTYSFALKPEDYQPTGSCNMSMVDDAKLLIKLLKKNRCLECYGVTSRIYATNNNVLIITGGMCGVLFSN